MPLRRAGGEGDSTQVQPKHQHQGLVPEHQGARASLRSLGVDADATDACGLQDAEFHVDYFKSFDFVMNALDNLGE